ncbi:MAG: type I-E CRISPR-associated protein Cse2/CasB [Jatrophihabitantaceae bacterium]
MGEAVRSDAPQSLADLIDKRIQEIQRGVLQRSGQSLASLAQLRRAAGKPAGSVPEVWGDTIDGLSSSDGYRGDGPTRAETAAHLAMTLYAVHQQSQNVGVHRRGRDFGLGAAVARLREREASRRGSSVAEQASSPVTRRFMMLGTAQDLEEVAYHARGLINQLRGGAGTEAIRLDYALLAHQFVLLQDPAGANQVRLAWGRDFYRAPKPRKQSDTPTPEANGDSK